MRFNVITLFPQMFAESFRLGIIGQAAKKGLVSFSLINPRDFATDAHKTVDDRPFGGGDGMVMLAEPLRAAVESIGDQGKTVYLSPHGKKWSDELARSWAEAAGTITLICGRYGGVDQRFLNSYVQEEVSLGDFVLSGGEPAAVAIVDSVVRLLPGALGNAESADRESFVGGLLEHPQFTRPRLALGQSVPEVLLGGHHAEIVEWQRVLAVAVTATRRPDLLKGRVGANEVCRALERALQLPEHEIRACGLFQHDLSRALNEWRTLNS